MKIIKITNKVNRRWWKLLYFLKQRCKAKWFTSGNDGASLKFGTCFLGCLHKKKCRYPIFVMYLVISIMLDGINKITMLGSEKGSSQNVPTFGLRFQYTSSILSPSSIFIPNKQIHQEIMELDHN